MADPLRALVEDFPLYAERCLRIQPKRGGLVRLVLNPTQLHVHAAIERQRAETGRVRAIVLKARKQGVSTYYEARAFHRVTTSHGLRAKVIAHQADSTKEIFEMVRRFYTNLPEVVKPEVERNSLRELKFRQLDGFMSVSTAGSDDVGRGGTPHLLHASEFGVWRNAKDHRAGILESVADEPGTEIVIESTAKGVGTEFHEMWKDASAGRSEYLPIFIPWFMDPTYRRPAPGFERTDEESELARIFQLDDEQLAWRRSKIANLGSVWRFMQENPATPDEAFQSGNEHPYVPQEIARGALGRSVDPFGDVVLGVDPARKGKDRFVVQVRRGPQLLRTVIVPYRVKADSMAAVGAIVKLHREHGAKLAGVDGVGLGGPIADRLRELGLKVVTVNAGTNNALNKRRYSNLQTEMYADLREWLETGSIPADNPHAQELLADISAPSFDYDSNGRDRLENKDSMAERGLRSPDLADALAISIMAERLAKAGAVGVTIVGGRG